MLQADKGALEQSLRVQMLSLQWRELEYLHTNFQSLATSSALLTGFGFAAISLSTSYHPETATRDDSVWELSIEQTIFSWRFVSQAAFEAVFFAAGSFGLAFNLLSLFIATVSLMCGPGMALRGPEGSVVVAVRHLELQLQRALRFFGRGVVAFTVSIMTIGVRRLHGAGFLGGGLSILIGLWTLRQLYVYGADIAEKFFVSPDRAVRGVFVEGADGTVRWQNTAQERASTRIVRGWSCCGWELGGHVKRWRPQGHNVFTPLWRLDKTIAFPYLADEGRVRMLSKSGSDAVKERHLLQKLVLSAQGPIGGSASAHVGGGLAGAAKGRDTTDILDSILGAANGMFWGESHDSASGASTVGGEQRVGAAGGRNPRHATGANTRGLSCVELVRNGAAAAI